MAARGSISNRPLRVRKKKWRAKSRTIPVPDKCIIAFLRPKAPSDEEWTAFLNQAAHDALVVLKVNAVVLGLDNWSQMRILDEDELEKRGFIHKDRIFLLKDQIDMTKYTQEELEAIMKEAFPEIEEEEE